MNRFSTVVLTLSLCLLPVVALAVEVPGEVVQAPAVQSAQDTRAAWETHLRLERAARLQSLRAYAAAGQFPRKPGMPGWHHQFLDANGTPCAVANLIATSGHMDLVQATAAIQNDVELAQVKSGPLLDWVATSGLTIEEIAVIQEPGFEMGMIELQQLEPEPANIAMVQAEQAEQQRIRTHLAAVLTLLEADAESSIAKAMSRLGDRVEETPPSGLVASLR